MRKKNGIFNTIDSFGANGDHQIFHEHMKLKDKDQGALQKLSCNKF